MNHKVNIMFLEASWNLAILAQLFNRKHSMKRIEELERNVNGGHS
jgi:hypothetical protein